MINVEELDSKQCEDLLENFFEGDLFLKATANLMLKYNEAGKEISSDEASRRVMKLILKLRDAEPGQHFSTTQEFWEEVENKLNENSVKSELFS